MILSSSKFIISLSTVILYAGQFEAVLDDRLDEPGSLGRQPDAGLDAVPHVQAAMDHFERAVHANPSDPTLYHNLMQVNIASTTSVGQLS